MVNNIQQPLQQTSRFGAMLPSALTNQNSNSTNSIFPSYQRPASLNMTGSTNSIQGLLSQIMPLFQMMMTSMMMQQNRQTPVNTPVAQQPVTVINNASPAVVSQTTAPQTVVTEEVVETTTEVAPQQEVSINDLDPADIPDFIRAIDDEDYAIAQETEHLIIDTVETEIKGKKI